MNKILKLLLGLFSLIFLFFVLNLALGGYYFSKYQQEIVNVTNEFFDAVVKENPELAYKFLPLERQKALPYDRYKQMVQDANSTTDPVESFTIKKVQISSVVSPNYFGPEAIVTVEGKEKGGAVFVREFNWIMEEGQWKLVK